MSTEDNKALVRRFYTEVWNRRNLAVADELFAPTFTSLGAPPAVPPGPEGIKQFVTENVARLSDLQYTIDDMIAEGDKVAAQWTARGTNTGALRRRRTGLTLLPTGKQVAWSGTTIFRVTGGQIVEERIFQNLLGVFQELGLVVEPA